MLTRTDSGPVVLLCSETVRGDRDGKDALPGHGICQRWYVRRDHIIHHLHPLYVWCIQPSMASHRTHV